MFSGQSFLKSILGSSFVILTFNRGIRTVASIDLVVKSDDAPAPIGTVKLFGTGRTDGSALCRKLHGHPFSRTLAADLVFIETIKANKNKSSLPYVYSY